MAVCAQEPGDGIKRDTLKLDWGRSKIEFYYVPNPVSGCPFSYMIRLRKKKEPLHKDSFSGNAEEET